jgi:hypothetical protein
MVHMMKRTHNSFAKQGLATRIWLPANARLKYVRRLFAICFPLLFSFQLLMPVVAATGDADSKLPACYRRNGTHHCMMNAVQASASLHRIQFGVIPSKCPLFPKAIRTTSTHDLNFDTAELLYAQVISHPAMCVQIEARARVALERSRHKRGPPSTRLS